MSITQGRPVKVVRRRKYKKVEITQQHIDALRGLVIDCRNFSAAKDSRADLGWRAVMHLLDQAGPTGEYEVLSIDERP